MAQTTVLAAGTTGATSTDIVVAAGESVTVGLFVASGGFTVSGPVASVLIDTPGADTRIATLDTSAPTTVISGPGTFRVARTPCGQAIGVYTET